MCTVHDVVYKFPVLFSPRASSKAKKTQKEKYIQSLDVRSQCKDAINSFLCICSLSSLPLAPLFPCYSKNFNLGSGHKKSGLIWEGYKRNFKGSIPPKVSTCTCTCVYTCTCTCTYRSIYCHYFCCIFQGTRLRCKVCSAIYMYNIHVQCVLTPFPLMTLHVCSQRGTKLCGNPCPICRNEIKISYTVR